MKTVTRIFVNKENISATGIIITGSDVRYIVNVLRKNKGDSLIVLDGSNKEYLTEIDSINRDKISCKIIKENRTEDKINIDITLVQAIPKHNKMDLIVEKATELGVSTIIPIKTERTIYSRTSEVSTNKIARWRRIAKESSEQCGRCRLPFVENVTDFDAILGKTKNYDLAVMPWELETEVNIKDILRRTGKKKKIIVIIGAEGGFSLTEVNKARDNNISIVSLGQLVLRVETAAIITLGVINYEWGTHDSGWGRETRLPAAKQ